MEETIYASFVNLSDAERATGALLDHGLKSENISLLVHEDFVNEMGQYCPSAELELVDFDLAKSGITTTTIADASVGALKGSGIGLGIGLAVALASIFIPGMGLVLGSGALAMAIVGAFGATGAGAVVGGILGFLKDQGVPEDAIVTYVENYEHGGAVLSVSTHGIPSLEEIEILLTKYNAVNVCETHPLVFR